MFEIKMIDPNIMTSEPKMLLLYKYICCGFSTNFWNLLAVLFPYCPFDTTCFFGNQVFTLYLQWRDLLQGENIFF